MNGWPDTGRSISCRVSWTGRPVNGGYLRKCSGDRPVRFRPHISHSREQVAVSTWFRIVRRIVLGNRASEDEKLTNELDDLRRRANWAFAAFTNKGKLKRYQKRVAEYLRQPEPGSLISRLPNRPEVEPESQVAQWLFAFDAAGIATFRALALLGCQPDEQARAVEEADAAAADRPFARAVLIDAVRLWPTTPAILRELTEDHIIGGQTIRKGTGIIIFAPFFHRDDEHLDIANRMSPATWRIAVSQRR